jgi:hypothetical protein
MLSPLGPALALAFHLERENRRLTGNHFAALEPLAVAIGADRHLADLAD